MSKETINSPYPGLIFRETFDSEATVLRNGGVPTDVTFNNGDGLFNSTSSKIVCKKVNNVKSIRIILKANSVTKHICKLSSTHSISVSNGTISATGVSTPTIYVNGDVSSTLTTSKSEIIITTATSFNAIDFQIGYITSYFDGNIELVELYSKALTASEVANLYNSKWNVGLPIGNLLLDFNSSQGVSKEITGKTLTTTAITYKKIGINYSAIFNGTTSKIVIGNIGDVQSLNFNIYYTGISSNGIINLNGTDKVNIVTGAISHYGSTCYINGSTTTTLSKGWNFITIISSAKSATSFQIGYNGTNYYNGKLQRCTVYGYQITLAQHTQWWSSGRKLIK